MRKVKKVILAIFLISPFLNFANNIKVDKVSYNEKTQVISFEISWENSWKDQKNHDAAWVFIKFIDTNGNYIHGKLRENNHHIRGAKKDLCNYPKIE